MVTVGRTEESGEGGEGKRIKYVPIELHSWLHMYLSHHYHH